MLQPEAEGTNEEPPIHHDDFINQMDELSDEDEVKHRAHSIICSIKQLRHAIALCKNIHVVFEICG